MYLAFVGQVPPGHVVRLMDGDVENLQLGNLMMISRKRKCAVKPGAAVVTQEQVAWLNYKGQVTREVVAMRKAGRSVNVEQYLSSYARELGAIWLGLYRPRPDP